MFLLTIGNAGFRHPPVQELDVDGREIGPRYPIYKIPSLPPEPGRVKTHWRVFTAGGCCINLLVSSTHLSLSPANIGYTAAARAA